MEEREHHSAPEDARPVAAMRGDHPKPGMGRQSRERSIVLWLATAAIAAVVVLMVKTIVTSPDTGSTGGASSAPNAQMLADLPQFDQVGDGTACAMHYSQTSDGNTVTRFTINQPGELITHVSGPDGNHRNDQQVTANYWAYTYSVPLNQVTDMGAVLYLADGTTAACAISPGTTAP